MKVYRLQRTDEIVPTRDDSHSVDYYVAGMPPMMKAAFSEGAVYACGSIYMALEWLDMSDLWDDCSVYELEVHGPVIKNDMYRGTECICVTQADAEQVTIHVDTFGAWDPEFSVTVDPEGCQLIVRVEHIVSIKKVL